MQWQGPNSGRFAVGAVQGSDSIPCQDFWDPLNAKGYGFPPTFLKCRYSLLRSEFLTCSGTGGRAWSREAWIAIFARLSGSCFPHDNAS